MTEKEILAIFEKTGAILKGHFKLSSGLHSAEYLQCAKVLQHSEYAELLCRSLADKCKEAMSHCEEPEATKPALPSGRQSLRLLRPCGPRNDSVITAVVAPALGGIIVSYEVARALGVKSLFTERIDGKMTLRRGFELTKNDNVLVVEDVVTTGLSTKEVIEVVKSCGAELAGVGCIVDRSKDNIDFGTRFESLVKIDIPTFNPETCPMCKNKTLLTKPGSRSIT